MDPTDRSSVPGDGIGPAERALIELGRALRDSGYHFIAITPESHARVNQRSESAESHCLRDVFGWSRPFRTSLLPPSLLTLMERAGVLVRDGDRCRSAVRFASLGSALYVHSAYPTREHDAVFFGPDTYRFASLIQQTFSGHGASQLGRVVDVGCGSGAGGLQLCKQASEVVLADINAEALRYARVNAALGGADVCTAVHSDVLSGVTGDIDVVISNPPYIVDASARLYRDGGGPLGIALSVRIAETALERLRPGGQLLLYTGVPIILGEDPLLRALQPTLQRTCAAYSYGELDPDVFGEELSGQAYAQAERIAVVSLHATRADRYLST